MVKKSSVEVSKQASSSRVPDRNLLPAKQISAAGAPRLLTAVPDTMDFRDLMYVPTLIEVPVRIPLEVYREQKVPILDQGQEGACTGFGLAAVVHYLLRHRRVISDTTPVSPRMLYEMAKRYDEWPGEEYDGSSARGAMKGWHKHGVCSEETWPYRTKDDNHRLTEQRMADAVRRPMGAYFRVDHTDLVAMHSAISEVGVLYATSNVHAGWQAPGADGLIQLDSNILGGHAFAIVGFDQRGFWIQNSWGVDWGLQGFGLVTYDDWLANSTDVWVARLGSPVELHYAEAGSPGAGAARQTSSFSYADVRPHIISIGNDGKLRTSGTYGTSEAEVAGIFRDDFPRLTAGWKKKRLLLYAHGGLVAEGPAVQRIADYRAPLLDAQVYPLAFIWKTDFWTTLKNILEDALSKRRPEGFLDATKDFMLDRLDDALEVVARLPGKAVWDEMKENGELASNGESGGARFAAQLIAKLVHDDPSVELHVVGHSAGSIFHAPLISLLTSLGLKIATCTMWAPACTVELFNKHYLPAITSGALARFALFTLTDPVEQDDHCAHIYHKSLLYLVSNACEARQRIPVFRDGVPILGMEKFINKDPDLKKLVASKKIAWVKSPNFQPTQPEDATEAMHHGDFDDDLATVRATLARIVKQPDVKTSFIFPSSASALRARRNMLPDEA